MRVLLDTHAFLWWISDDEKLSSKSREIIKNGENELFLSAASGWEISIKVSLGKLALSQPIMPFVTEQMHQNAISGLPIEMSHALHVYHLPPLHKDPFDRILVAQSQLETMPILTIDSQVSQYEVEVIW